MTKKFQPLNNYVQSNGEFATIRAKLQQNQLLLKQVQRLLPAPLDEHCLGLVIKQGLLVLYTDSSAWASRLRYFSHELEARLKRIHIDINKITVKVMVDNRRITVKSRGKGARLLTTKNSSLLQRVADHTSDPDLSAALRRLSSHSQNRK